MKMLNSKVIVPDTSILIHKKLSELIREGKIKGAKIVIPKAVIDELQAQASRGRDIGFEGLEEIKKIRELGKKKDIKIEFRGQRPTLEEIQLAKKGRIDALIRDVAEKEDALLITSDYVQALVGDAEGVKVEYIPSVDSKKRIKLESFFDEHTQSVHLKAGVIPMAKKGPPGNVELSEIRKEPITEDELKSIIDEIISRSRVEEDSFIEIGRIGATVIQHGNYRIAVTRPPFSDGLELTAVRPIAKVKLDDYKLHKELEQRLTQDAGMLIAGPPGAGKSSFAGAVAEFLSKRGNIVKTFEQPRDLQVGPEITQYSPLEGDWEKTAELLLLVRPDYTIFDEVRRTKDFRVFADMRLAGVGMIGVIHATNPVSAIQRFIGRLELGIIPYVIDTVIFIKAGKIDQVYEISLVVKIPTGMQEADLARPVVEVRDFATKELAYEIYTYGEENIIIPVKKEINPLWELAKETVYKELSRWDRDAEIDIVSNDRIVVRVRNEVIPRLIGKKGQNIEEIEKKLNMHISVEPKEQSFKKETGWTFEETGAYFNIRVDKNLSGTQVDFYSSDRFIFSAFVGNGGYIRIKKHSEIGKEILSSIATKNLRILV